MFSARCVSSACRAWALLAAATMASGCGLLLVGGEPGDRDAGPLPVVRDGGAGVDAAPGDAADPDSAAPDRGAFDQRAADVASGDAAVSDRGLPDAAASDLAPGDQAGWDTPLYDGAVPDAAFEEDGAGDAGPVDARADSALADGTASDASLVDSTGSDRLLQDATPFDAEAPDLAPPDTAPPDAQAPDLAGQVDSGAPWVETGCSCRAPLTVDGTIIAEALVDFPVLVSVQGGALACGSRAFVAEGARFFDDTGQQLSVDREPSASGEGGLFWVRLATVAGYAVTRFWIYFDCSTVDETDTSAEVWSNAYQGVWHLTTWGDPDLCSIDSTHYGHCALAGITGSEIQAVPGKIGLGNLFTGEDFLTIHESEGGALDPNDASFTYSMWVQPRSTRSYDTPFAKGGNTLTTPGYDLELGSGEWEARVVDTAGNASTPHLIPPISSTDWFHLAVVVDRAQGTVRLYVNGLEGASTIFEVMADVSTGLPATIGANSLGQEPFYGVIDELRIAFQARSADWIAAQYRSMNGELVSLGDVEAQP